MERFTAGWIRPETGYIHLFFIAMKVPHSREGEIWHSRPLLVTRISNSLQSWANCDEPRCGNRGHLHQRLMDVAQIVQPSHGFEQRSWIVLRIVARGVCRSRVRASGVWRNPGFSSLRQSCGVSWGLPCDSLDCGRTEAGLEPARWLLGAAWRWRRRVSQLESCTAAHPVRQGAERVRFEWRTRRSPAKRTGVHTLPPLTLR